MTPAQPDTAAPLYQTDLAQTPLPEILVKIHRYKASGRVECTRGDVIKRVDLEDGAIFVEDESIESLLSIFGWDFGAVTFTPGRYAQRESNARPISVPQTILRGVRRMPDPRALLGRIGTRTKLLERSKEPLEDLVLAPDEENLLGAATGKVPLADLVNTPPNNSADNARLLYGLFTLGLLAPKERLKVQLKTARE